MSLRMFHLLFIVLSIFGADLFAVWAVANYLRTADVGLLVLGVVAALGGVGLLAYAVHTARKLDQLVTR